MVSSAARSSIWACGNGLAAGASVVLPALLRGLHCAPLAELAGSYGSGFALQGVDAAQAAIVIGGATLLGWLGAGVTGHFLRQTRRCDEQGTRHPDPADPPPRVMVVDGSKLVRKLIGDVGVKELPNVEAIGCAGLEEAKAALDTCLFHLVTTALILTTATATIAKAVRTASGQAYVPVIVAGEQQARLEDRSRVTPIISTRASATRCSLRSFWGPRAARAGRRRAGRVVR